MTDADVIIVGGGPAGASLAWHLATRGVRTVVLDRARFPRPKPCAEYLSPEASRILEQMGALDACESGECATLAGMIVRAPSGDTLRGDFAGAHGFRGFRDRGLALRREILDSILLECARTAGAAVVERAQVAGLDSDSTGRVAGVRIVGDGGPERSLRAPLVVGADGLRSTVARRLGLARFARHPRRLALVTHFAGVAELADCGEMHVSPDGYLGIAPVGGGLANVALVVPTARAREFAGHPERYLERWIAAQRHLAPRFRSARRVSPVRATGPFAQRARRAWARGAALVGDAADFFDPFTGEGIYAALRGGALLAPFVERSLAASSHRDADRLLSGYERARRREFAGKWMLERFVALAVAQPPILNHIARVLSRRKAMADLLVGVAGDFVPAREAFRLRFLCSLFLPVPRVGPTRQDIRESATLSVRPARTP